MNSIVFCLSPLLLNVLSCVLQTSLQADTTVVVAPHHSTTTRPEFEMSTAQVANPAATATAAMGAAGNVTTGDLSPTITIPAGLKFDNTLGGMFIGCILGTLSVLYLHPFA